mgnify:CR=1 FL=1
MDFQWFLDAVLLDYHRLFHFDPSNIKYVVSDDMFRDYSIFNPAVDVKERDAINENNGIMICPNEFTDSFVVLINKIKMVKYLEKQNMTWIGTIAHETTHVKDYSDYASLTGIHDFGMLQQTDKHLPFQLWTEFHARAVGYYFVRKYTLLEDLYNDEVIEGIVSQELPNQTALFLQKYHETNDGFQQAYFASHYLGRLYTLQKLYPSFFTDKWLKEMPVFNENKWLNDWYWFLKRNDTLQKAYNHFEEMKDILRQNFSGI